MGKAVDLDALDAAYAKPHSPRCAVPINDVLRNRAELHFVLHDAYPAMSSELRERRAREEAMAAEIRALREVAEAARAFYGHVTEHHRTCPCCDVDDSSLCEPTCRFNAIADALAKVPR